MGERPGGLSVKRVSILLVGLLALASVAAVACGGGGDDDDGTPGANTTRTTTARTATKSGTPGSETATGGTPGANATPGASGGSVVAGATGATGGTPGAIPTRDPNATPGANTDGIVPDTAPTPSQAELDAADGISEEDVEQIYGGDPTDPPTVITDLPDQPADASTDPTTVAAPEPDAGGVELIVDLNASEAGIQSTREIKVGDIVRVGLVIANVPPVSGGVGGLAAFDFVMRYDRTKIIAPTIVGGSSLDRNPDLNQAGLSGSSSNWACVPPAPEGDMDDPGAATGDGDPATGQAYISCYWPSGESSYPSGHLVAATVIFQAVAPGTIVIDLQQANAYNSLAAAIASCGSEASVIVPCRNATLTVR